MKILERFLYLTVSLLLAVLAVTVLTQLFISTAEGKTWYVDDDGGQDFEAIQDAVNVASDGDVIIVLEGNYLENVKVDKTLTIQGSGPTNTTITAKNNGYCIQLTSDWCNLSGLGFLKGTYNSNGVLCSSNGNHIFDNHFTAGIHYAIFLNYCHEQLIENNSFNKTNYGINLVSANRNVILSNSFQGNGNYVFRLDGASNNRFQGNQVDGYGYGAYLTDSDGNELVGNSFENGNGGFYLLNSKDNKLENNSCRDQLAYGIYLKDSSARCDMVNNTCHNISGPGILVEGSFYARIINNSISECSKGIFLRETRSCTVNENQMTGCSIVIEGEGTNEWTTHVMDGNNTVNGKPVYFYRKSSFLTVPEDAGEVIILDCEDIIVRNISISNSSASFIIAYSAGLHLGNLSSYDNSYSGIVLYNTNHAIIENCSFTGLIGTPLQLESSHYNTMENLSCNDNQGAGIYLLNSKSNTIRDSSFEWNTGVGAYLDDSGENVFVNNSFANNRQEGVYFKYRSDENELRNNSIIRNGKDGIFVASQSDGILVLGNNISHSAYSALDATSSNSIVFSENVCYNVSQGIDMSDCNNLKMENNTILSSASSLNAGISKNLFLFGNSFNGSFLLNGNSREYWDSHTVDESNNIRGEPIYYYANEENVVVPKTALYIIIASCKNVTLEEVEIGNTGNGIIVAYSSYVNISRCSVSNQRFGIRFLGVSDSRITDSVFFNTSGYALDLDCSESLLYRVSVTNGTQGGIGISGDDNIIEKCNSSFNSGAGFYIKGSGNEICNSSCYSNTQHGIFIDGLRNVVSNSSCRSGTGTGILLEGTYNRIENTRSHTPTGLWFGGAGYSTIENCSFENMSLGIRIDGYSNNNVILNSSIRNNDVGVYQIDEYGAWENEIHDCNISGNRDFALKNEYNININATDNYWGHPTGPYHPQDNSPGKGGNITDYVLFDPWVGHKVKTIWNLDKDRGYTSLQKAVDDADSGDTIRAHAGRYKGNLLIDRPLTLIGNGTENTTIMGEKNGEVVRIQANWVNLSGFEITNGGTDYFDYVIRVEGFDNCHLRDLKMVSPKSGIYLESANHTRIENCEVLSPAQTGIMAIYSREIIICNTTVSSCSYYDGIYIEDGDGAVLLNNTCNSNDDWGIWAQGDNLSCSFNTCDGNGAGIYLEGDNTRCFNNTSSRHTTGIFMEGEDTWCYNNSCFSNTIGIDSSGSGARCFNNTCYQNSHTGVKIEASFARVYNNTLYGNTYYGLNLIGKENRILNNTCYDNDNGIRSSDSQNRNNLFQGNNCSSNDAAGFYLYMSSQNRFLNNIINSNENGYGMYFRTASNENTVENNSILKNRRGIIVWDGCRDLEIHNNTIAGNEEYGAYALNNNGIYVNASLNWWGHESGPRHPSDNPFGKGDNVTDYVNVNPREGYVITPIHNVDLDERYFSIQDALDEARDGDTILADAEIYNENIIINRTITLRGNSSSNTTIQGDGTGKVVRIQADNVVLEGFTLSNSGDGDDDAALWINESEGCMIRDVTVRDSRTGVYVLDSSDIRLRDINCSDITIQGARLEGSDTVSFVNLSSDSGTYGVHILASSETSISWGNFSDHGNCSILSEDSTDLVLEHTNLQGGGLLLKGDDIQHWNTHTVTDTQVNGKALVYRASVNGEALPTGAGQIILADCEDVVVDDQNCSGVAIGLIVAYSRDIRVMNSSFSGNVLHGVLVLETANSSLEQNTCSGNQFSGIRVLDSSQLDLVRNRCGGNEGSGIDLMDSLQIRVEASNSSDNGKNGIRLFNTNSSTLVENHCTSNDWSGILLDESGNCRLENNSCSREQQIGILLSYSRENFLAWNSCNNEMYGIYLLYSTGNRLLNNSASNNSLYGFVLWYGSDNRLRGDRATGNQEGVVLYEAKQSNLSDLLLLDNTENGVSIGNSEKTELYRCLIQNSSYGVESGSSDDIIIEACRILDCDRGVDLGTARNCYLNDSLFSGNNYGVYLTSNQDLGIHNSNFSKNYIGLYLRYDSRDVVVRNSTFMNNTALGISAKDYWGEAVNATGNWWGHCSGPYHQEENDWGMGDNVTENVLFDPWVGYGGVVHNLELDRYYESIQEAIDDADPGQTIRVHDGLFRENLVINKTLTLIGNGSRDTMVVGELPEIAEESFNFLPVVTITADDVVFEGFTVGGFGFIFDMEKLFMVWGTGVAAVGEDIIISNNSFQRHCVGIFAGARTFDINTYSFGHPTGAPNMTISGNTFLDIQESLGIHFFFTGRAVASVDARDLVLRDNHFEGCGVHLDGFARAVEENTMDQGTLEYVLGKDSSVELPETTRQLFIFDSSDVQGKDLTMPYGVTISGSRDISLRDCWIDSPFNTVSIQSSRDIGIEGCHINASSSGVLALESSLITLGNNTLLGTSLDPRTGLDFWEVSGVRIQGNHISNFNSNGISFYWEPRQIEMIDNVILGARTGIFLDENTGNCSIRGNEIRDCQIGVEVDANCTDFVFSGNWLENCDYNGLEFRENLTRASFDNNTLINCDTAIEIDEGARDIAFENNTLDGVGENDYGLVMESFSGLVFRNNTIVDYASSWDGYGVSLENGEFLDFSGNEFEDCKYGMVLKGIDNSSFGNDSYSSCIYQGLSLSNSENLSFDSCLFRDNDKGLRISGTANVSVSGCGFYDNQGALNGYSSRTLSIQWSQFRDNTRGLDFYPDVEAGIHHCEIADNSEYGLDGPESVNASHNYWGSCSGPYKKGDNPGGTGNELKGNAIFRPWFKAPEGNEIPVATLEFINPGSALEGDLISFAALGSDDGEITQYSWHSDIDGEIYNGSDMQMTWYCVSTGTHLITLKVMDNYGIWSGAVTGELEILGRARAKIVSITPGIAAVGQAVHLVAAAEGYGIQGEISYEWTEETLGVVYNGSSSEINLTKLSTGTYRFWLRVLNDIDLWSIAVRSPGNVVVSGRPVASIDSIAPWMVFVENPMPIVLTGNATDDGDIERFVWRSDIDGIISNSSWRIREVPMLSLGRHSISLMVLDDVGLWSNWTTFPEPVIINSPPGAAIVNLTPCPSSEDGRVTFEAQGWDSGEIVAYLWSSSLDGELYQGNESSFSMSGFSPGNHTITLWVEDDLGAWSEGQSSYLKVYPRPDATIQDISPSPARYGQDVIFNGSGAANATIVLYSWRSSIDGEFYQGVKSKITDNSLSPGVHVITLMVMDNFGSWSHGVETTLLIVPALEDVSILIEPVTGDWKGRVELSVLGLASEHIVRYAWSSSRDGELYNGTLANVTVSGLSTGVHNISLHVQEKGYGWRLAGSRSVEVKEEETPPEEEESEEESFLWKKIGPVPRVVIIFLVVLLAVVVVMGVKFSGDKTGSSSRPRDFMAPGEPEELPLTPEDLLEAKGIPETGLEEGTEITKVASDEKAVAKDGPEQKEDAGSVTDGKKVVASSQKPCEESEQDPPNL